MKDPGVGNPVDLAAGKQAEAHQPREGPGGIFPIAVDGMYCTRLTGQKFFLQQIGRLLAEEPLAEKKKDLELKFR